MPMPRYAFFALALLAAGCGRSEVPAPTLDPSSRRELPAGAVVGYTGAYGSHVWRGIPYAQPPLGPLRWRAPRPLAPWTGEREALATGQACPQYASVYGGATRDAKGVIGGEDCLYLDVYAPRSEPGSVPRGAARLPVLFWIHGGGNTIGRAGMYDGGNLATTHDVVVVAINYRLGPFGWFRHAALRGGDTSEADRSGNFGTLDAIRALEWVRDNVASFGGDPGNVTIFGESAGGNDVYVLMLSPRARGLFHRAILQSPGMGTASVTEAEGFTDDAEPGHENSSNEVLAKLLVADGSAPDRAAARARIAALGAAELATYLRARPTEEILERYATEEFEGMLDVPGLFRDGYVLPAEEPTALLERGAYNQVPVIFGTNRDENKLFMAFDPELAHWWLGLFPRARDGERYDAHAEHLANAWKWRAVDRPASLAHRAQGPSVYAYRWDWDEEPRIPLLVDGSKMIGASHGLEIAFVFGHFDLGPESGRLFTRGNRAGREALSTQMMSYWAEFARTGSPGRGRDGSLPEWTPWSDASPDAPRYIVFDTPAGGGLRLASKTIAIEDVVAAVAADARLDSPREKCAVMRNLAAWEYIPREQYATANGGLCAKFAMDAYPWLEVAARR